MIVYDKKWLENLILQEQADSLLKGGFINKDQKRLIEKELPSFKIHYNILIRIGFFLLGVLLYFSIGGAISLFGYNISLSGYLDVCCYIFSFVGLVGSEFFARNNYYRHGLDEAFIFGTILNAGIAVAISTHGDNLAVSIVVTIVSLILYLRYLHLLSVLIFYLALTLTVGYIIIDFREAVKAILPFFMIFFSIGTYYFCRNLINNLTETFYHNGILLVKSISLMLLYLSGNYFVVREFSAFLIENYYYEESPEIPFAWFFWCFTFLVPVFYLFYALKNKQRVLLWIGLLCLCFSFYTFRSYHHVLPPEVALTLGGLILFVIAFVSIKKLKNKESGLTFKPDRILNSNTFLNAEALIIASTFGMKPEVKSTESPMEFGGGGFSGGGSGGSFNN